MTSPINPNLLEMARKQSNHSIKPKELPNKNYRDKLDVILDPSLLSSPSHLSKLYDFHGRLFVPRTIKQLSQHQVEDILPYFGYFGLRFEAEKFYKLVEQKEVEAFEAIPEYVKELTGLDKLRLPSTVSEILAEEYSFIRSHSYILARLRKTFHWFKRCGVAVLDTSNKDIKDKKEELFESIRGVRWIIGVAIAVGGLFTANPILGGLGIVIAVTDP